MRARFGDAPLPEHDDAVGALQRRDTVADEQGDAPLGPLQPGVEHLVLVAGVERAGRLVKDHDRGVAQKGPRHRQPLPLPLAQFLPFVEPLAQHGVITVRQTRDHRRGTGLLCRRLDAPIAARQL